MKSDLVDLEVQVKCDATKNKAVAIYDFGFGDEGKTIWLPRSQIEIEYRDQSNRFATVTMPEWLAQEKGLI